MKKNINKNCLLCKGGVRAGYKASNWTAFCRGIVVTINSDDHCFLQLKQVQKNPVNTDTKGICLSVCIILVSDLRFLKTKTKAGIFTAIKFW